METGRDSGPLLIGIVLVVLGLLFLSGNFGYGTWFNWDRWWPVVLIAIGVVLLYRRSERLQPGPGAPPQPPAPVGVPAVPGEPVPPGPGQPAADVPAGPRYRYPTGALILIGIGAAFLLDDVIGGNAFPALVLIAIGLALVLRTRGTR